MGSRTNIAHAVKPSAKNQVFIDKAKQISNKFSVGVVNPVSEESLKAALLAADMQLISPVLIGPSEKIQAAAKKIKKDISNTECIDIENHMLAALKAAELAREGRVNAIMKGDIHTDEIMKVVVSREAGLRTGRRISHCLVIDIPTYEKIAIFTDPAVNIAPDLTTKKNMVQNAIDFAHALGIKAPNVALLAATESVLENMPSTLDAAVLCKMAERGQITGAVLDGPISIDLAISEEAMQAKRFKPGLKGLPDIFVAPDIDSCNIGIKILDYMANGQSAGIVLGAKIPVILMRRSSPAVEHVISCALAKIYAKWAKLI